MQHKARQGEYTGGQAPYSRRVTPDGAQLEPHPDEKAARAVARLCLRPEFIGLGKQPPGVERRHLDRELLREDQMRDREEAGSSEE